MVYILTESGEILYLELRPKDCTIKYKLSLPKEVQPIEFNNGDKKIVTINMAIYFEFIQVYSKNTQKIYQYQKEYTRTKSNFANYQPVIFDALELLKIDKSELNSDKRYELEMVNHKEISSVFTFDFKIYSKDQNKNEIMNVENFTIERKILTDDQEDFSKESNSDWWLNIMNNMKIPLYIFTIFVIVGINLWWRGSKKKDESSNIKSSYDKKYRDLPGLNKKVSDWEENYKNLNVENDDDIEIYENKITSKNKGKKTRFSDEVNETHKMEKKLEDLIQSTSKLGGEQQKIKDMMTKLDRFKK